MRARWLSALWTSALLSACVTSPAPTESRIPLPDDYALSGTWSAAEPADLAPKGNWWERFGDPSLNALQERLGQDNPGIKIALARLEEARAAAQAAAGGLWPKISVGAAHSEARTAATAPSYSAARPNPVSDYTAAATLSYEVDLFGRVRLAAAAARAQAAAAQADVLALELTTRAELTLVYLQLRSIIAQQDVLQESIASQEKALQVLDHQRAAGLVTAGDVAYAETQLETVRTQLADTVLRRDQTEHAIAVLLGQPPSAWRQAATALDRAQPVPSVLPGRPSALLQRRPDIAAAQRRVEFASQQVGLARRAYFPIFTLGAALGRESTSADRWFTAPARFWSIAPSAAMTLLDGGQRRAQTRTAIAALQEATENYRRTVLAADQEVEDQMAAVLALADEANSASRSVDAALLSRTQTLHRLAAGSATALDVASAQNAVLSARINEISIAQRRIAATVLLVRALGGYWE